MCRSMNGFVERKINMGFGGVRLPPLLPLVRITTGAIAVVPTLASDFLSSSSRKRMIDLFFFFARYCAAAAGVSWGCWYLISEIRTAIDPLVISENFPHPFVPHIHLSSVEDKESLYRFVKLFLRGEDRSFPSFRHDHF